MTRLVSIILAALLVACGGRETTASKSAAAYREAQAKGIPVGGGHEHGGHAVTESASAQQTDVHAGHTTAPAVDHAAMGHAMTDHAAMGHGAAAGGHAVHSASPAGGHSAMQHQAATDHSVHREAAPDAHAQHGAPAPASAHTQHDGMQTGPSTAVAVPKTNAVIARTEPAATLRQDEFDVPSPVSVAEAAKAAPATPHEGHKP